jgi:hypothetical protein
VINIISKGVTAEFGGSVFAEAGTDGYLSGAIDFSGPIDDVGGFSLFVTAKDDGEPVEGTTFDSESASGRLSFANGENWDLRIFGNYADSAGTAFPEESGGYDLAVLRDVDTRTTEQQKLGLNGSVGLSDRSRLNVLATWYDQDSSYFSPGVAPGIRDPVPANGADSQLERTDLAVNVVVDVSEDFAATVGVDHYDEAGTADGFVEIFPEFVVPSGFRFDRNVTGIFGELHYQTRFGATLLASVRRDDPNTESTIPIRNLGKPPVNWACFMASMKTGLLFAPTGVRDSACPVSSRWPVRSSVTRTSGRKRARASISASHDGPGTDALALRSWCSAMSSWI